MDGDNSPRVAILVLTYNNAETVRDCLNSVCNQDYRNIELHILDNASHDDTVANIPTALTDRLRINSKNIGYAAGMNQLFENVSQLASFVVFLNSDCELDASFVSRSVQRLADRSDCAALAPLVWRLGASESVVDGGMLRITKTMRVRLVPIGEAVKSDKPNGSCPVYRINALDDLARQSGYRGFDEKYDTYGEDIDLALRLTRRGWSTYFDPSITARHQRSGSSGTKSILGRRGRLRRNVLSARYVNAIGHLRFYDLLWVVPLLITQDLALICLSFARRDVTAGQDVAAAWKTVLQRARKKRLEVRGITRLVRDSDDGN